MFGPVAFSWLPGVEKWIPRMINGIARMTNATGQRSRRRQRGDDMIRTPAFCR
jgi:hypothetical protein